MKFTATHVVSGPELRAPRTLGSRKRCSWAGFRAVTIALVTIILCAGSAWAQHSVVTQRGDTTRDGLFSTETYLTTANVNSNQFGLLFSYAVDGYVAAQPLYVSGVNIPNVGVVNVVYVATLNDSVYAFNADSGALLWSEPLLATVSGGTGSPEPISLLGCGANGYTEVGIVGTPVIDLSTDTMYLVAKTYTTGTKNSFYFNLHALDITTGAEKYGAPVVITASSGSVNLSTYEQWDLQRPGLLEVNGNILIGFGSNGCDQKAYGWLLAYNAGSSTQTTIQQLAVFNTSPDQTYGASIWMSGVGPAADSSGNIYLATANGNFDANVTGGLDRGDTVLQMQLTSNGGTWSFSVPDYFTPYNQQYMDSGDLDLGSGGVVLLPNDEWTQSPNLAVAEGKTGTIYLINTQAMGGYNNGSDKDVEDVVGATGEMYGAPIYWNGHLYTAAHQDKLKAFSMANGMLSMTPALESSLPYTLTGVPSLSANGNENGVLWLIRNTKSTGGVTELSAFDASSPTLQELYNTQQVSGRDGLDATTAHFATPLVANGKVYVGTESALKAYALFPELNPSSGNNQSATVNTPITLSVQATNPYSGAVLPGVSVTFGSGNKGTFSQNPVTTDSTGTATVTYTLPETAGTYALTASSAGYSAASLSEIAVAGPAASITVISGSSQSGTVGSTLPKPLVVKAKDSYGNNVSGASITYSNPYNGTFSSNPVNTGVNGEASVTFTLPTSSHVGFAVTASSGSATPATFHETSAAGAPASEAIVSGNNQKATAGSQLPKPLVVSVKDQYGNLVPGVTVTFSDGGAGGSFLNSTPITNGGGQASATYTLPPTDGTYSITATVSSYVVTFTETAKN